MCRRLTGQPNLPRPSGFPEGRLLSHMKWNSVRYGDEFIPVSRHTSNLHDRESRGGASKARDEALDAERC